MVEESLSPLMGHSLARRPMSTGSVFSSTAKNFSKQIKMFVRNDLCSRIGPYQQEIRYGGGVAAEGRERASPYFFVAARNFLLHDPISYMYTHM